MKRHEQSDPSRLPVALAAGPDLYRGGRPSWLNDGRAWSVANGHGPNGWRALLPADVIEADHPRHRFRLMLDDVNDPYGPAHVERRGPDGIWRRMR